MTREDRISLVAESIVASALTDPEARETNATCGWHTDGSGFDGEPDFHLGADDMDEAIAQARLRPRD